MPCRSPVSIDTEQGPIAVRCKQCLSCRISKQSALSLRALLESRTTWSAQFWTLTYAEAPEIGSWDDMQKFLKRYRIWNRRQGNMLPIRYLACGEYGSKSGRFHYHALIFNGLNPPQGDLLTRLWPHGFAYIGTVTPGSIRYTARYTLKFEEKGRESLATWSKRPPLGADGMAELAQYMRRLNYGLKEPPKGLRIENRNYSVDETMQLIFGFHYFGPDWTPNKGLAQRHFDYVLEKKIGDPLEKERIRQEERNTFWNTARVINEKL